MTSHKIKVLVVDDSALIRALLTEVLESDSRISVCGAASDPYEARDMIKRLQPDVLTLDVEMPKMNGIAFLKNLMRLRPLPVVMISTLTQEGAPATLQALELGAVDFISKPKNESADALERYREEIVAKVIAASRANVQLLSENAGFNAVKPNKVTAASGKAKTQYICAIGASTGGTEAIKQVITSLPENCPPIVVTQHIPEVFSASFAKRVDSLAAPQVFEAVQSQPIKPGCVYIAPGHSHLRVKRIGNEFVCKLDQGDLVNRHRPSVEVLFDSVIDADPKHVLAIMLTGMGADGAEAMLRMRKRGYLTFAQDEASSVVWGMPGAAVKLDAVNKVLALDKIALEIMRNYLQT